jgi:hypothetical protein
MSEKARLTSAGNLGIGLTAPNERLTVEGILSLDEVAAPTATAGYGKLYATTDNKLIFMDESGSTTDLTAGGGSSLWTDGGATTYLTATSDNVGIGTATADTQFHIYKESPGANEKLLLIETGVTPTERFLCFRRGK